MDREQSTFKQKKKSGSLRCLKSLLKRLEQNPKIFQAYDQVIRDRLVNNVIQEVSENQSENPKEFLLPHRPVTRLDKMQSQKN